MTVEYFFNVMYFTMKYTNTKHKKRKKDLQGQHLKRQKN
jgi:hypothetical protein